ncbi:MAG TPA: hypothetical protein VHO90_08240 [Bacteroidales bacterium]|jgi:hypothetical protein|nr:hypothetical protein [Bacteroidales bacterium]
MQKVTSTSELKEVISKLEQKQHEQWIDLKDNINVAFDSLKPINLLKSTYREFLSTPHMAENIVGSTIGLTSGLITKKLIVRKSGNVLRNLAGGLAQMLISNFVARNSGLIKTVGSGLIHKMFYRRKMETGRA